MKEELKHCPFCGNKPRLEHRTTVRQNDRQKSEILIYWKVSCGYCGCERDGGYSDYIVDDDGQLKLYTVGYSGEPKDARKEAIEKWNRRTNEQ